MPAFEVFIPSEGQAARFYDSLSNSQLAEVDALLFDDIEKHPQPDDPEPPHLLKTAFPVAHAANGVLATDGKYFFYYHFPQPGIVAVVWMGRARPPFADLLTEE